MNWQFDIAVIGASVAGSRVAALLAGSGRQVALLDPRAPWEKPCGGGLTHKVFLEFGDVVAGIPFHENSGLVVRFHSGRRAAFELDQPIRTVSRLALGKKLLDDAIASGAEFIPEKVKTITREDGGFEIETHEGQRVSAPYIIGADGWNSLVRRTLGKPFVRANLCLTYGALLPEPAEVPTVIGFFPGLMGYAWMFPRRGRVSVGLALEKGGLRRDELVKRLAAFVADEYSRAGLKAPDLGRPYAWLLPALSYEAFQDNPVQGEGWALIGDASASSDPVTGEGIYYALKTADMLFRAIDRGEVSAYAGEFKALAEVTVAKVAKVRDLFYRPDILAVMGFGLHHSESARQLARDLIAGSQPYHTLKARVKREAWTYGFESLIDLLRF